MDIKIKDNSKLKLAPFTQLEYIESTGTQYIDTGIKANNNTRVVLDCMLLTSSGDGYLFGARDGWQSNWFCIEASRNTNSFYGNEYGAISISRNVRHLVDCDKNIVKLDNTTIKTWNSQTWATSLSNLMINSLSDSGNETYAKRGTNRFYNVKIYNNEILILNLIPCITDLGTPGMYDTVSQTFFYNQGTGNFVAGPVVIPGLPANILLKTTTLYHKNTPNVDGLQFLNSIIHAQEEAENVVLNRIRVDIGNVSRSLSELMQYAGMAGFNDNYEPQTKPRLVGTWTINDWYTTAQLAEARAAFDGLTIVEDPNYLIDFSQMAVQTLDNTQPNYNPAVAIILANAGYGTVLPAPIVSGQEGRFMLSKTQASNITNNTLFKASSVTDSNGIVTTDTGIKYTFNKFHEFRYFTGYTQLGGGTHDGWQFMGSWNLQYFTTPHTIFSYNAYSRVKFNSCVIYIKATGTPNSLSIFDTRGFINTGAPTDRIVMSAYKDRYKDKTTSEGWLSMNAPTTQIRAWYEFACPQLSYDGTNVTITVERSSTIYYTTDGSIPTESSTEYTQPFVWDGQGVIKAIAVDNTAHPDDRIAYADNFYAQTCANPVIVADSSNNQITLSCATPGAVIHYTIDGSYPTLDSPIYSAPITSQEDIVKVRCFATAQGYNDSEVAGKICVLDDSLWGTDSDTSAFAVQCMDSTKPNYNPAFCLGLYKLNLYSFVADNGFILTKTDASNITSDVLYNVPKGAMTDSNNILGGGTGSSYRITNMNEFRFFTGITSSRGTGQAVRTSITSIILPPNLSSIYDWFFDYGALAFVETGGGLTSIYAICDAGYCSILHMKEETPPSVTHNIINANKIYVGDGSSSTHDDAILQAYVAATRWSAKASILDTWYNYLHPTT